jgi:hypothetical protein
MTNVIQISTIDQSILDQAEIEFVDGVSKTGELLQAYADVLCQVFDRKDSMGNTIEKWFNLTGKEKKGINERKASFVQRMINRGYTKGLDKDGKPKASGTVDVYWQRVKEASGYVTKGNRVTGGTDVDSKTLAELKTMINRILKSEEEGKDCTASMFKGNLMEVFEGMGGDVDNLG